MPKIGEIKKAAEIGINRSNKYIWCACLDCGRERWVMLLKGKPLSAICKYCTGKRAGARAKGQDNGNWKGGRVVDRYGYVWLKVFLDDFFYPMANIRGYVREHRLVMAKHLGRHLTAKEIVHHINSVKDDNRIENLHLTNMSGHPRSYEKGYSEGFRDGAKQSNKELEKQIKSLKWHLRELRGYLQLKIGEPPNEA